jgi:acyl-CoA reductase-like NAD-dependent aldehyde dehydrogenase
MTFTLIHELNSELAPHSAQLLTTLLPQYLDSSCFQVVNGAVEVVTALLEHPYGHIMYTGAGPVGSIVMAAASKFLTPVTLELGGKSPVIVTAKQISLSLQRGLLGASCLTQARLACVPITPWSKRLLC